jgi:hypothetical protein
MLTPDSLLSPKEIRDKMNMGEIIFDNTRVENNKLILNLKSEELENLGISYKQYEKILHDMEQFNNSIDSLDIDAHSLFEESKARFYEERKKAS